MRLVSSFKDYYDGLRSTDREPLPLYVRQNTVVGRYVQPPTGGDPFTNVPASLQRVARALTDLPRCSFSLHLERRRVATMYTIASRTVLLFCGQAFVGYRWNTQSQPYLGGPRTHFDHLPHHSETTHNVPKANAAEGLLGAVLPHGAFVTYEELLAAISAWTPTEVLGTKLRTKLLAEDEDNTFAYPGWTSYEKRKFTPNTYAAFAANHLNAGNPFPYPAEAHRAFKAPVLQLRMVGGDSETQWSPAFEVTANPSLVELGFPKRLSATLAWQALDQYLGNEMAVQMDPLPMDDVYRRDAHGFDDKSFKQAAPGEKKARRAKRRAAEKGENL